MNALKIVQTARYRAACLKFHPGTGYALELNIGNWPMVSIPHALATEMGDVLAIIRSNERVLPLLAAFRPGLTLEDVKFIRAALGKFEEEMSFELRRPEPRQHKYSTRNFEI